MAQRLKYLLPVVIMIILFAFGCNNNTPKTDDNDPTDKDPVISEKHVEVISSVLEITIKNDEINNYDFASLFIISEDYQEIEVKNEYLDLSSLKDKKGTYYISCKYLDKWARVKVNVLEYAYSLTSSVDKITIKESEVSSFDYLALFEATKDMEVVILDSTNVNTNVCDTEGNYYYEVNYQGITKEIEVRVIPTYDIQIYCNYLEYEIEDSLYNDFDYTSLFNVFIDGEIYQLTEDNLEIPSLSVGEAKELHVIVTKGKNSKEASISVSRVADYETKVTTKNLITYPNASEFDYKDLFIVTVNNQIIEISDNDITGTVNYSEVGVYPITLNYEGNEYVSTIEVLHGVIIEYSTSDTINISLNTNKNEYDFTKDFIVNINGIRYKSYNPNYIDTTNVNFNELGKYQATIKIPYNTKALSLSGVSFDYYEKTITYNVCPNAYQISVINEILEVDNNTNILDNISLKIRGRNYVLLDDINADYIVSAYACVATDIDYNTPGVKDVNVLVYVDGVNNDPITVAFKVSVSAGIIITKSDAHIFSNNHILLNSLFEINDNGETVEVTSDMIYGNVSFATPGCYEVYLNYKNLVKSAFVYVNDEGIIGTYTTKMKKLTGESYSSLVIDENFNIYFEGTKAKIINDLGNSCFEITIGMYEYTLNYQDGIIFLDADNSLKISFHDQRRPLVFFDKNRYTYNNYLVVNSLSSGYILNDTITGYSFDIFSVTDNISEEPAWYGLKTHLTSRMNSDTIYNVSFAKLDNVNNLENEGSFTFMNSLYEYESSNGTYKIKSSNNTSKPYKNKTFNGVIDDVSCKLSTDQYEAFSLIGSSLIFSASSSDINGMKNGGIDYANDIAFLYDSVKGYSYKFKLNTTNNTFEYLKKDNYFGKYECDNYYIFLDGYGTGIVSFDSNSHYTYQIKYVVTNNKITIYYQNINQTFTEGTYASFFINPLYNVLTINSTDGISFNDKVFTNSIITNGAIITIKNYIYEASSDSIGRASLLDNIIINTKDGIITGASLNSYIEETYTKYVDYSKISFGKAGFYELKINSLVDGNIVTSYYAIEVLGNIYEASNVVGYYTQGLNSNATITITKFGIITLIVGDLTYKGFVNIKENDSFNATLYNGVKEVSLKGNLITNGVISIQASGAISLTDYFTSFDYNECGNSSYVLYKINSTEICYLLFRKGDAKGEVCTLESINEIEAGEAGSRCIIRTQTKEITLTINNWSSLDDGLSD